MGNGLPNTLSQTLELAGIAIFFTTSIAAVLASIFVRKTNMLFLGLQLILLMASLYLSLDWSHRLAFDAIFPSREVCSQLFLTGLMLSVGFTLDMTLMVFLWDGSLARGQDAFPRLLVVVVRILIYLTVTLVILQFVYDKSITALATLSGAFALILGLSAQTTLGEMFAGIAIALSRPFSVGDWVKVGQLDEGRVIDMTWRLVRIQTRQRNVINVPNRVVADAPIRNFSRPSSINRIDDAVYFDLDADPIFVQDMLLDAMRSADGVLVTPSPFVFFFGAKAGVGEYWMRYFIDNYQARDDITERVWRAVVDRALRAKLRIQPPLRQVEMWQGSSTSPVLPAGVQSAIRVETEGMPRPATRPL
jgi:small-conductance mechanosensitive channel